MAELPPVERVLELEHGWNIGADHNAVTQTFWRYSGNAPSAGTLLFIAEAIKSAGATWLAPLVSGGNSNAHIRLTDLSHKESPRVEVAGFGQGSRAGTANPANCALLLNLLVARRYRGGKPRNYLPLGVGADLSSESTWAGAFISSCNEKINAWIAQIAGITHESTTMGNMVSVSYYSGGEWLPHGPHGAYKFYPKLRAAPLIDVITAAVPNATIGSQRRRLRPG